MSEKEKAKELFDKYFVICQEFTEEIQCSIQAKQCALIAVDEIIKAVEFFNGETGIRGNKWSYYQGVKLEIQKL